MPDLSRRCQADHADLDGCPSPPKWLVRAGKAEQSACSRHLARVCDALSRVQGDRVTLGLVPLEGRDG